MTNEDGERSVRESEKYWARDNNFHRLVTAFYISFFFVMIVFLVMVFVSGNGYVTYATGLGIVMAAAVPMMIFLVCLLISVFRNWIDYIRH